ncbi:hypothetical protein I4U23_004672 [Adineta vaga]|nr:hypothetical protein I4U23_004672 [Adineta vaga]
MSARNLSKKDQAAFKRYKFDEILINKIAQYTLINKTDNYHGPLAIIEDWTIIVLCAMISQYVFNNIHLKFAWTFVDIPVICIIGARQRGLARGYVIFQSFYGYQTSHVKNHHPYLGTDRDPDYQGLKENNICGINRSTANVKRYLRSLFLPSASVNYLLYLIKYRIWTKDDDHYETLIRCIYLGSLVSIFFHSGNILLLLLYWIIPYFTTHMWIGSFIELMEHYPMIETAPRIDIFMTRNRLCGWFWNFFFGVHNEQYHLVHHLFPKVPEWEYHNVHRILMQDSTYANLHEKLVSRMEKFNEGNY